MDLTVTQMTAINHMQFILQLQALQSPRALASSPILLYAQVRVSSLQSGNVPWGVRLLWLWVWANQLARINLKRSCTYVLSYSLKISSSCRNTSSVHKFTCLYVFELGRHFQKPDWESKYIITKHRAHKRFLWTRRREFRSNLGQMQNALAISSCTVGAFPLWFEQIDWSSLIQSVN